MRFILSVIAFLLLAVYTAEAKIIGEAVEYKHNDTLLEGYLAISSILSR